MAEERYSYSMRIYFWFLLALGYSFSQARTWYVAPAGQPENLGTFNSPISLPRALGSNSPAQAGDTVLLLQGVYQGSFESVVSGGTGNPIRFMPAPGHHVVIDGATGNSSQALFIRGEWVEFYDLEITNSNPDRMQKIDGVRFDAPNSLLANCVIHNTSMGIGFWTPAQNSQVYGNIIFNNGYQGAERGHGHAIYTQNQTGTKIIRDNIIFFGYGQGIQAYTENGFLEGFNISRNVWFRAGASLEGVSLGGNSDGLILGGLQPVDRSLLQENFSWTPDAGGRSVRLGWGAQVNNIFVELRDNYLVGNTVTQGSWQSAVVENNDFFGSIIGPEPADFPRNRFSAQLPSTNKTVVHRNEFDQNRARIIIYNWQSLDCVPVDVSQHLAVQDSFVVHSVFDLPGTPVLGGSFSGQNLCLPMGTKAPPQPHGFPQAIAGSDDPGKLFGVFILRRISARGALASIRRNSWPPMHEAGGIRKFYRLNGVRTP